MVDEGGWSHCAGAGAGAGAAAAAAAAGGYLLKLSKGFVAMVGLLVCGGQ